MCGLVDSSAVLRGFPPVTGIAILRHVIRSAVL